MLEYRRHLPHQIPADTPLFITWNLKGAIPQEAAARLRAERELLRRQQRRPRESSRDRDIRLSKLSFAKTDDFLDRRTEGPLYLRQPESAKIVEDSLLFGVAERYSLFAWCVMPNHVHALFTPRWPLSEVMRGIKGVTSRQINRLQGKVGRTLWQDESYDHWVRDADELLRIVGYIEYNPVKAGLCPEPAAWPWSSARFRQNWPMGQPYRRSAFPG